MLSGDAFIRAIARVMGKEYGNVKMIADVVMIVISVALSTVFLHQLAGVREGTVLSAVLVGMLIKKYKKMFAGFERKSFRRMYRTSEELGGDKDAVSGIWKRESGCYCSVAWWWTVLVEL